MIETTAASFDCRSIDVFETPHLQHVCRIQVQKKLISCLKWHPLLDKSNLSPSRYWLASSSRDAAIHVFNLQKILSTFRLSLVLHLKVVSCKNLAGLVELKILDTRK